VFSRLTVRPSPKEKEVKVCRFFWETYAFTGIRCAEALALRIKDYDRSSLTLSLPKVKGANSRLQPIPHRLFCILEKWISILSRNGQADLRSLLFCGRHPERSLTTRQTRFRFNRWKAQSGIREDLTVHSFRAGFATQLYRVTGDLLLEIRKAIEKGFCQSASLWYDEKTHTP
jgi:integrase